jgi:hypothetical protein
MRLVVGGENGSRIISGICMDRSSVVTLSRMIFVFVNDSGMRENDSSFQFFPHYS